MCAKFQLIGKGILSFSTTFPFSKQIESNSLQKLPQSILKAAMLSQEYYYYYFFSYQDTIHLPRMICTSSQFRSWSIYTLFAISLSRYSFYSLFFFSHFLPVSPFHCSVFPTKCFTYGFFVASLSVIYAYFFDRVRLIGSSG